MFDYHVHIGQFEDVYYHPYKIADVLMSCGIEGAYVSSTTSCIQWNTQQEKDIVIEHIKAEVIELLSYSRGKNFIAKPMCWIIPQRYYDGETVEEMYYECNYYGFKIHPRAHDWNLNNKAIVMLLSDICKMAERKNVPILIHTGMCEFEKPSKFEYWFEAFPNVKFILAHCRNVKDILELFSMHNNLYGDVAFSTPGDLQEILNSEYCKRLLFGTDFPITIHHRNMRQYEDLKLYENYNKILSTWSRYTDFLTRR